MASKVVYSVVAIVGIAAASGAAWWYQSKPQGPREIPGTAPLATAGAAVAPAGAASAARTAGVEVAKVERVTLRDDAQSVGSLRSRQSVMLRPEVAGRVKELGFSDGAQVRKGQLLVQLDDTLQRAEIRQALAQVSIAQANFKRNQELVAQSFVAQRVLDESAANLQVAEAQLALGCARLSRMAIVAPFDATVGIRNVNLGDYVKDGADLINLEDTSSMYVDFRLPERFQTKLRLRQSVELQIDAIAGRVFKATVEAIDPLLDVNGRSVGVRAVLPNTMGAPALRATGASGGQGGAAGASGSPAPAASGTSMAGRSAAGVPPPRGAPVGGAGRLGTGPVVARSPADTSGCPGPDRLAAAATGSGSAFAARASGGSAPLRPGMFARVTTVFAVNDRAVVVPEEAIVPQGGRQYVIKVVQPSAVPSTAADGGFSDAKLVSLRQEVTLGARQLGKVEITQGLVEGDTVVVAGQHRLQRDGTPLRVVDLNRPTQGARPSDAPAGGASAAKVAATP